MTKMHQSDSPELNFWRKKLAGPLPVLRLPGDRGDAAEQFGTAQHSFTIRHQSESLAGSREQGMIGEPDVLLRSAFVALLLRYTGQEDFIIGDVIDGNVLVLRLNASSSMSFGQLVAHVNEAVQEAVSNSSTSFGQVISALEQADGTPLSLNVLFAADIPADKPLLMRSLVEEHGADLGLLTRVDGHEYKAEFVYNTAIFSEQAASRLAGHFRTLFAAASAHPASHLGQLPMLTEAEHRQLAGWNRTAHDFPRDACLHQLFESNASARPDATAMCFEQARLTYGELDARANQLANYLIKLGVTLETRVGICTERSIEMVVGILGILKAGAAYVPLDPAYPIKRQAFMLRDSRVSLLLTQKALLASLPENEAKVVALDGSWQNIAEESSAAPQTGVTPANLAYVIYTSGSTGTPKGIALRHQGVVNNVFDLNDSFQIGPQDSAIAISSLSFDMCVYEILGILAAGGKIVTPSPARLKDVAHWAELVKRHRVTVWNSAPQLLEMLVEHVSGRPELAPESLRVAILGGDWVPVNLPDRLKSLALNVQVVVLGGATEASIHSIVYPVQQSDPAWRSIPYGKPMRNQRAYILDRSAQPVPIGVAGELHLGGIGLARGYFDQPALTSEKFIPNPFSGESGDRIYKTGDLARWLPDGNIELLGRIDYQVKIRGHRIELGEIASLLEEHVAVSDCVVLARKDETGEKRLVAYVVPSGQDSDRNGTGTAGQYSEQIAQWQSVYDDTYGQDSNLALEKGMNFVGWVSSYTGEPFSEAELRELLRATVDRILALNPSRVLEIGCGTGLVLFQVAPQVSSYDASDFSDVVVESLQRQIKDAAPALDHVRLYQRLADNMDGLDAGSYDTVIINSVTQHFPDLNYLKLVLQEAVKMVKSGGCIFIGDIRSLPHLGWFHRSIEMSRASDTLTFDRLEAQVQRKVRQEKELFIAPVFFRFIQEQIAAIDQVEIRLRDGLHHNEMTRFHYDVVLHIGSTSGDEPAISWLDWQKDSLDLNKVKSRFQQGDSNYVAIRSIPNSRVREESLTAQVLDKEDLSMTLAELRVALEKEQALDFTDPETLREAAKAAGFHAEFCWSTDGNPGHFDAIFYRKSEGGSKLRLVFPLEQVKYSTNEELANQPLLAIDSEKLVPQLRDFLSGRLPDYMLPSAYVVLEALPLSANGKIDRRALPPPDLSRPQLAIDYIGPRNPVEQVLAGIWSDALGLKQVGMYDSFFELGGHSLTATRIISRIRAALQIKLPLRDLFEQPCVAELSEQIVNVGANEGIDVHMIADTLIALEQMSDEQVKEMLAAGEANRVPDFDEPA